MNKIKKDDKKNNTVFIPFKEDDEWISVKRDNNYRIVYNDKIVKKIKSKFLKQIQKQKKDKLDLFHEENIKLKKGEKSDIKGVSRKEHNSIIDEKCEIIGKFYDNKIDEIKRMSCSDFIINYLNKEDTNKIKNLMNTNLSSKFTIEEGSTNI